MTDERRILPERRHKTMWIVEQNRGDSVVVENRAPFEKQSKAVWKFVGARVHLRERRDDRFPLDPGVHIEPVIEDVSNGFDRVHFKGTEQIEFNARHRSPHVTGETPRAVRAWREWPSSAALGSPVSWPFAVAR